MVIMSVPTGTFLAVLNSYTNCLHDTGAIYNNIIMIDGGCYVLEQFSYFCSTHVPVGLYLYLYYYGCFETLSIPGAVYCNIPAW